MANFRAGASSLYHWLRTKRGASRSTPGVDRAALQRGLRTHFQDFDALLAEVRAEGVAAVPGYWPKEKCDAAITAFDRILAEYPDHVRVYSGGSDQRMYGMESADPLFADFHHDRFLKNFGEVDGGLELYNFATLGGRIAATGGNTGSGDGWHRDAFGHQFKTILYLTDTAPQNGPFQYLLASHKDWRVAVDTALGDMPQAPNTRYRDADIDRLIRRMGLTARSFPATAGTLLLVNTAGVHRGMPLQAGVRYALTNYYYNPSAIHEARIDQFSPLMPGTAERVRQDLF
jgi:hypothetical protein